MVFGIVLLLVFIAIVFFHYLQGFFSSALSAIIAVIAAVLAFSYHERIAVTWMAGKAPNVNHALILTVLFAVIYFGLRLIFDAIIPSGVSLPQLIDRIGGAVMGMVAAICALGILSVAAQELPFGATVAGYSKYETVDRPVTVVGGGTGRAQDSSVSDELTSGDAGHFDEAQRKNLFPWAIPGVDELLVGMVAHLSGSGSLAGDQSLSQVHPDFLQELFGQRAGIQGGALHVASAFAGAAPPVTDVQLFTVPDFRVYDGELGSVRPTPPVVVPPLKVVSERTVTYKRDPSDKTSLTEKVQYDGVSSSKQFLLVVRIVLGKSAADVEDNTIRFSPGSVRLVADKAGAPHDYYPIGTLQDVAGDPVLYADKPDDYLVVPFITKSGGKPAVDLVYLVDKAGIEIKNKIDAGVFFEFKRTVLLDLGGKKINPWTGTAPGISIGVLHKRTAPELPTTRPAATEPAAAPAAP